MNHHSENDYVDFGAQELPRPKPIQDGVYAERIEPKLEDPASESPTSENPLPVPKLNDAITEDETDEEEIEAPKMVCDKSKRGASA
jgi:hypothetical protein